MRRFRELDVWSLGHEITLDVYRITRRFPKEELYGLTSQMRRAAYSVPMNSVEGSVESDPQFCQALRISLGSASELEYQLLLAADLDYLEQPDYEAIARTIQQEQRILVSFMKRLHPGTGKSSPKADSRWLMAESPVDEEESL